MMQDDYTYVCSLIMTRAGIFLGDDKQYLVESRINPIARRHGFASITELVNSHRVTRKEAISVDITEAMTTNETFFFRDTKPFEQFRQLVLPHITSHNKTGRIRIWSAASSSGQEAYSLAMCIREDEVKMPGTSFEIFGTDLSAEVVERAKAGIYSQFEVQRGLPIQMLMKYFQKDNENWKVKDNIKSLTKFQTGNLLNSFDAFGKFDYVLCRNVLISMSKPNATFWSASPNF